MLVNSKVNMEDNEDIKQVTQKLNE